MNRHTENEAANREEEDEEEEEQPVGEASESPRAAPKVRRKKKRTSEAWSHFETNKDGIVCLHCQHVYSKVTATGTLMLHIKKEHGDQPPAKRNGESTFDKFKADAKVSRLITDKCLPLQLVDQDEFIDLLGYL